MPVKFGDFVRDEMFEQRLRASAPTPAEPLHGRLKHWNADRYYGFVTRDGGDDCFVHGSTLDTAGIVPVVGMRLMFEVAPDRVGRVKVARVWREED